MCGKKNPEFNNEFKIKLPTLVTKKHHLLFSFFDVQLQRRKEQPLNSIGHSVLLILNEHGQINNEIHTLEIFECESDYRSKNRKKKGGYFKVQVLNYSTVYPNQRDLAEAFSHPAGRKIKKLREAFKNDPVYFLQNLPVALNLIFDVMCNTSENKIITDSYLTLLDIVYNVSNGVRNEHLVKYCEFRFKNPRKCMNYPFLQLSCLWLALLQEEHKKIRKGIISSGKTITKSLLMSWWFFEIINKSIILYLKKNKIKGRLKDKHFCKILNLLLESLSMEVVYQAGKQTSVAKELNLSIALFIRDLFNSFDRGFLLTLVDRYLRMISKHSKKQKELIQEFRMSFLRIISDYEHYVPLSLPKKNKITSVSIEKRLCDLSFLCGIVIRQSILSICDPEQTVRQRSSDLIKDLLTKHEFDQKYNSHDIEKSENRKKKVIGMYFPFILYFVDLLDTYRGVSMEKLRFEEKMLKAAKEEYNITLKLYETTVSNITFSDVRERVQNLKKVLSERRQKVEVNQENYNERKIIVSLEYRHILFSIITILFYMDRSMLRGWFKVENKEKVKRFIDLLGDCIKYFEYKGKSEIEKEVKSFGCEKITSSEKTLKKTKELLEEAYTGGVRNLSMKRTRAKKKVIKRSPMVSKQKVKWEGILSNQVSFVVLDILYDFVSEVKNDPDFVEPIFYLSILFFETNQSNKVLIAFFEYMKDYLVIFRDYLFQNETPYSEKLCLCILKKCYSRIELVRSRACGILFLLIKSNYLEMGNFIRTKIQATTIISGMATDLNERSVTLLKICFKALIEYASSGKNLKEVGEFSEQVQALSRRLKVTLNNTLKITAISSYRSKNPKADSQLQKLLIGLCVSHVDAPELCITWYKNLSNFHNEKNRKIEAAQSLCMVAGYSFQYQVCKGNELFIKKLDYNLLTNCSPPLLSENFNEMKKLFKKQEGPLFSSQHFTEVGFIILCKKICDLLKESEYYEYEISLCELMYQYYKEKEDVDKTMDVLSEMVDSYKLIKKYDSGNRYFGTYFFVGFYGKKLKKQNGKVYIYKFPRISKWRDVFNYFEKQFFPDFGVKNVKINSLAFVITPEIINDPNVVYIKIGGVDPYFEEKRKDNYFDQNVRIKQFVFETSFTKTTRKRSKYIKNQWKRKTILEVRTPFPNISFKNLVIKEIVVEITPIENAFEILKKTVNKLKSFFVEGKAKENITIGSLQLVLSWAVIPQVQEGIPAIVNCFMTKEYEKERIIPRFKDKLKEFLEYTFNGIVLNARIQTLRTMALHKEFVFGYKKLHDLISPKLENFPERLNPINLDGGGGSYFNESSYSEDLKEDVEIPNFNPVEESLKSIKKKDYVSSYLNEGDVEHVREYLKNTKYKDYKVKKPIGGKNLETRSALGIFFGVKPKQLKGANSAVYVVEYGKRKKTFVMKIILNIGHYEKTTKIYHEFINPETLPIQNHKNIVPILHCFKDKVDPKPPGWKYSEEDVNENTAIFIMPFYPNSLDKFITESLKKYKKPVFRRDLDFFKFLVDVTSAILHLLKNKYVHRDVKEENIFISYHGNYVLGDFGCCLDSTEFPDFRIPFFTNNFYRAGSPYYMPNEIRNAKPGKYSYLSYGKNVTCFYSNFQDIFALGMICYKMYSDEEPFGKKCDERVQENYIHLKRYECKSKEIRDLIKGMLMLEYEKRLSAKDVFQKIKDKI